MERVLREQMIPKALQLLGLLPLRPAEFCDRVLARVQVHWRAGRSCVYHASSFTDVVADLERALSKDLASTLHEAELAQIETEIETLRIKMPSTAPFPQFHNGGSALARMCYALTRALRPTLIAETGVCYGVTSAHFLQALATNGSGQLHSIDLPPLGGNGDDYVGALVPLDLRSRWNLYRGATRRLLSPLTKRSGPIDIFLHDSLHTYSNMRSEFNIVWPALRPGAVLIADDIEANGAFHELTQREDVSCACVVQETSKDSMFGLAVKAS